jgi:tetratricopeptide (TPR) repeat protein
MERVDDQLAGRLASLAMSDDVDALLDLGCELADAGRQADAERCFRRAADLGSAIGWFNLGNTLRELGRLHEAVAAYEIATAAGEIDAWLNLGNVLGSLGDIAGSMHAYRAAAAAGDSNGALSLAFELRKQGEQGLAEEAATEAAATGNAQAAAVLACWAWSATLDPALEADLRAGADHFPDTRVALADLLRTTGRSDEARRVLERGAELGETEILLALGNLYARDFDDTEAAETAYRAGVAAGDLHCHNNLGSLLWDLDDLEGAEAEFRLGAAAGDALAARNLRSLLEDEDEDADEDEDENGGGGGGGGDGV